MNTEILGVALQILLLLVISYPLGKHNAKVYKEGNDCMRFMAPIERFIYKLAGINPNEEMDWKAFLKSLLIINVFWFFWGMILLVSQGYLPLNPDGNSGQSPDLAFNTCISFMVNCNLQHYSGESGLTYFTQLFVIMLFQFITAATGMAAMAGIMKSIAAKTTKTIGNFWQFLVISCTRILLPLSLIVGFILILQGTPMGFDGKMKVTTMEDAKAQKEKEAEKPQEEKTARVRLNDKRKMSFKEKREFEQLEKEIAELETEKVQIEELLCSGTLSVDELTEKSKRLPEVNDLIDEKTMRWLELSEIEG